MACCTNNCQAIQFLVSTKGNKNKKGDWQNPHSHILCNKRDYFLSLQFKHGAKMCIQNKLGHYAIHTVAFAGAKEAMELVLEIGKWI